jgi:hypothetical protein
LDIVQTVVPKCHRRIRGEIIVPEPFATMMPFMFPCLEKLLDVAFEEMLTNSTYQEGLAKPQSEPKLAKHSFREIISQPQPTLFHYKKL